MSLSLVLADFGTLLFCFFLVVIFYSLSFLFVSFGYQNSCQPFESQQRTERTPGILALISKPLCRDSLPKIYNPNGEKQRERLSLDWGCYSLIFGGPCFNFEPHFWRLRGTIWVSPFDDRVFCSVIEASDRLDAKPVRGRLTTFCWSPDNTSVRRNDWSRRWRRESFRTLRQTAITLVMELISEKSLQQVLASRQRMLRRCWTIGRRCREDSHYKAEMP
jgi:hypothetical protein